VASESVQQKRQTSPFACVVLAAGAGTRFGGPKALAILPEGRSFAQRIVRTARACGAGRVVVVAGRGHAVPDGAERVENADPSSEQIDSVRLGLAHLSDALVAGTLLWPVDSPLVRAETVRAILQAASENAASVALPRFQGRSGHPTYFARDVWPELLVATSDGAREVVRRDESRVIRVDVDDAAVVVDIDTRAHLTRAVREAGA
jgi:molybdenum cofactor cytidylyltransferase